jgi:hypothetical protein
MCVCLCVCYAVLRQYNWAAISYAVQSGDDMVIALLLRAGGSDTAANVSDLLLLIL